MLSCRVECSCEVFSYTRNGVDWCLINRFHLSQAGPTLIELNKLSACSVVSTPYTSKNDCNRV